MTDISRRAVLVRGGLLAAASCLGAAQHTAAAAQPRPRGGSFAPIDATLREAVQKGTVAGVVAAAATPRGLVYEGAFGKADVAAGTAMTPDTVFWLLSMTKAFTATACMQLVEQGRLKLDDDASKYLPALTSPQVLEGFDADGKPRLRPARGAIKVRHLLTHTSGYTYSIWSEALSRYQQVPYSHRSPGSNSRGAAKAPFWQVAISGMPVTCW